ncbi:MAG: hypothetical protein ACYCVD_18380 [Desulfitobacteriaceae bacterium]
MQNFTPRQIHIMAKTLRDVIHAFGLSKDQLAALAKEFGITETQPQRVEVALIRALNDGQDIDWSKKRR